MTLTLPSGEKVRCQSRRRYVLVVRNTKATDPYVAKRSDNKKTIFDAYAEQHQVCAQAIVFDNATGEVLAQ